VASRTLKDLEWENSQLLEGDVGEAVARLKKEDGPELQVHGSSDLLQTLIRHRLMDRFQMMIFPVVLGKGKRLFGEGAPPVTLKLVDSKVFSTGVVMAVFEPAGEVQTGSFALEEPTEAEQRRRENL
jgi:dihydrofolate reductase